LQATQAGRRLRRESEPPRDPGREWSTSHSYPYPSKSRQARQMWQRPSVDS
jgi:hypothetical protein